VIDDKQVLVIDRAEGALSAIMAELDLLGFRVVWVTTFSAALEFVHASPRLSLVIASAATTEAGGQDFLARLKEIRPALPVIWGGRPESSPRLDQGRRPDSLIPEPIRPDALRSAMSALLAEHFYPPVLANAIQSAALAALETSGQFTIEGGAFLIGNRSALSDLAAIIAFSGEASGHLMVSMTSGDSNTLYRRLVPGTRSVPIDHLEDLVGELCNRILGGINSFFAGRGVSVQQTTPMFIRAAGSTMRYPGRRPSFGVELACGQLRIFVEYYLAHFPAKAFNEPTEDVLALGEVRYF
jgi:CheY-specific phosphatase CheX